jgi:hypothetical protein
MKPFIENKLSTFVLWVCMLITVGIFAFFYAEIMGDPGNESKTGIELILYWLYIIFVLSLLTTIFFAFRPFFSRKKDNARSVCISLTGVSVLALLLAVAYLLGSGKSLPIPGYEGNENTAFWLKLTDMWLYTIYLLIGLAIVALFGGIIWSYFKNN